MTDDGVLYLNAGTKHGVHTIVSLTSLRKHWKGRVAIACDDAGLSVAEWCAADSVLAPVEIIHDTRLRSGGRGIAYLTKTLLPLVSPFKRTLFVDADTLVVGDLSEAFPRTPEEVVLTSFADWVSTGNKMRGRISEWKDVEPERVARMLAKPYPAINTGVVGWGERSQAFTDDWHATASRRIAFITDELAAQLIFPDHAVRVVDYRFNASVVFDVDRPGANPADVRLYHGHGGKFWKKDSGRAIYLPAYRACLEQNRGNIQDVALHHKWFESLPADDQAWSSCYCGK